jgi:hypothetical protein
MPLRLRVCFRNFKLEKGHDPTMKADPDYCFKLRKHWSGFQGKCLAFLSNRKNYSCATARDLHTVPF